MVPKRVTVLSNFVPLGFDGNEKECDYTLIRDECTIFCYLNQERLVSFTMGMARKNRVNVWANCRQFSFPGSLKFFSTGNLTTFQFIGDGWHQSFFTSFFRITTCRDEVIGNPEYLREALDSWIPRDAELCVLTVQKLRPVFRHEPIIHLALKQLIRNRIILYGHGNESNKLFGLGLLMEYIGRITNDVDVSTDSASDFLNFSLDPID